MHHSDRTEARNNTTGSAPAVWAASCTRQTMESTTFNAHVSTHTQVFSLIGRIAGLGTKSLTSCEQMMNIGHKNPWYGAEQKTGNTNFEKMACLHTR